MISEWAVHLLSIGSFWWIGEQHLTRYLKQQSYTTNNFLNSVKKIYLPFTVADEDRGGEDWELRKTEDWGRQRIEDNQVADGAESRWTGERRPTIAWRATTDADDCVEAAKRLFLHATHQKAKKMSTTQRSKYWERGFGLEAREIEKTLGENYKSTSDRKTRER